MIAMKKNKSTAKRGRPLSFNREHALHAALQLFWQHGYEGTSIADLVSAIGIAPPSLYSAFGSKQRLYLEAIELYLQGPGSFLSQALLHTVDAQSFVRQLLSSAASEFTARSHPPGCIIANGLVASAAPHQQVAQHLRDLRSATLGAIQQRLEAGKKQTELPLDTDCANLARFYAMTLQGMSIQARDGASSSELQAVADMAMSCWPAAA